LDEDPYILDRRGRPVPERDQRAWSRWFEAADNRLEVASDPWEIDDGSVQIFTWFSSFDPQRKTPPQLWATAILLFPKDGGDPIPIREYRYASRAAAVNAHLLLVRRLYGGDSPAGPNRRIGRRDLFGIVLALVPAIPRTLDFASDGRIDGVIRIAARCIHV